ncbi:hypothetical protein AB0E62_36800 [Streptomyces sp. NPDC038707]|uniref:hypothetical protein n=1 Tax=Streptomyces sp. NPDC038707 TaxID=3154329 RepID=UPI0033F3BB25
MNVDAGGRATTPAPYSSSSSHPTWRRSRTSVPVDRSRCPSSTFLSAATTRSSARPTADRSRTARPSTSPHKPSLR